MNSLMNDSPILQAYDETFERFNDSPSAEYLVR